MKPTILRSDQSPMNERRWLLTLSCGHESWITQGSKPKVGKAVECPSCSEGGAP